MPEDRVLRLEHPVVLVREVHELGGDSPALQRGEGGDALRLDDAEVDMSIPTANSMKEDEAIAVAIAVARAQRK